MAHKWVRCWYINEYGREVGLNFCFGSPKQLRDYFRRYRLSKENLTVYNVYEGDKLLFTFQKHS